MRYLTSYSLTSLKIDGNNLLIIEKSNREVLNKNFYDYSLSVQVAPHLTYVGVHVFGPGEVIASRMRFLKVVGTNPSYIFARDIK